MAVVVPRLAATTLVVRDTDGALEVLMLRRSLAASFMPGSYVFPGGAVDPSDGRAHSLRRCEEAPGALARRLRMPVDAPATVVAALRECFEECGLWLGMDSPRGGDAALRAARADLQAGTHSLAALSERLGVSLATRSLHAWSHWVTPVGVPRRFDTRFFVAAMPAGQQPSVDAGETTALAWWRPADALARRERGEIALEFATVRTLESLLPFARAAELLEHAARRHEIVAQHPRIARGRDGERRVLLPSDASYAEVARLDPHGKGTAVAALQPGAVVRIAPAVRRITAPNPGPMTGPGTNSYLVGRDGGDCIVIDPGPAIESHIEALLAAAGGRLRAILVTHTHSDHSPAAARLAARTGAPSVGLPAPAHPRQDTSFAPAHRPADGEILALAGVRLQALLTPGHASNHVCWWLAEERLLFTGDHLMQGSTVVIDPPDGDMAAYLASLRMLAERLPTLEWLAPGHGFLVDRPRQVIEQLLQHRQRREDKIVSAVRRLARSSIEALLPAVYDDVPPHMHPVAERSLLAHLIKLQAEGRVRVADDRVSPSGPMVVQKSELQTYI
jgi:glyoxylase-like metal-dependent hydrolase (beta-lactamase superfamily II)/8-oxo-dGTP pyrophosphatase MutT (NUDIX family)